MSVTSIITPSGVARASYQRVISSALATSGQTLLLRSGSGLGLGLRRLLGKRGNEIAQVLASRSLSLGDTFLRLCHNSRASVRIVDEVLRRFVDRLRIDVLLAL